MDERSDTQVHRRPATVEELVHLARECALHGANAKRKGDHDRAGGFAELGEELLRLAEAGGGLVGMLYNPGPPEHWRVFTDWSNPANVDGTRPFACPESCRCRALPLVGSRQQIDLSRILT